MGLYDGLSAYTAPAILQSALNQVTANVDKREGAVIYDTLAPLAVIAAQIIALMQSALENTDLQTATGDWLDLIASQPPVGIYRNEATKAQKIAQAMPVDVELEEGTEYKTQSGLGYTWTITETLSDGRYVLTCNTAGAEPGGDYGELTPTEQNLELDTLVFEDVAPIVEGQDEETDENFRLRIWQYLKRDRYGGSFADYLTWCFTEFRNAENGGTLDGILFFPASRYTGGGNIKILPTAADQDGNKYMPATAEQCSRLKAFLDPETGSAMGQGKAPVGHHIDVEAPITDGWALDITVILKTSHEEITDEEIEAATKNVLSYFEEKRGEIVSELGESFPNEEGSQYGYITTVYIDRIKAAVTGSGSIFQSAQTVKKGNVEAQDTEYNPTPTNSVLPVITSINIHV